MLGPTTVECTLMNGGFKANIIPDQAKLSMNSRPCWIMWRRSALIEWEHSNFHLNLEQPVSRWETQLPMMSSRTVGKG